MSTQELHLSPSDYHRWLMDRTTPSLAFDGGDPAAWRRKLRKKLGELVGVEPPATGGKAGAAVRRGRVPLDVRSLWTQRHRHGTIEKIAFAAEPFADVVAYVCLPKGVQPPYTFFICLQGHSTGMHVSIGRQRDDETRTYRAEGDRDFGIGCMKSGLAALCIEQRSFGLRREQIQKETHSHGCIDAAMHSLMLGRTLIGERVFDVDRGIDYLESRGDVDMDRLGVMGNSGGGTISLFAAAMLDRVRIAMPSCYFCTFRHSIMSIMHCVDNYVPGLLRYAEMADVMGLFAPRPVVIVSGARDPIFPIAGVREAFSRLRRIYAAAGAPDRCHLVVGKQGHRFYANDAWPVALKELKRLS